MATELRILNTATTPPFVLEDDVQVDEALRLRYRIHDLRRPLMQQRLAIRHQLLQSVRATCTDLGLYEIETPLLGRSTPEGARDFLAQSDLSRQFLCSATVTADHEAVAHGGRF